MYSHPNFNVGVLFSHLYNIYSCSHILSSAIIVSLAWPQEGWVWATRNEHTNILFSHISASTLCSMLCAYRRCDIKHLWCKALWMGCKCFAGCFRKIYRSNSLSICLSIWECATDCIWSFAVAARSTCWLKRFENKMHFLMVCMGKLQLLPLDSFTAFAECLAASDAENNGNSNSKVINKAFDVENSKAILIMHHITSHAHS